MGVVEPEKLKGMRPYVIVGAFVIGMFLTPPDVFSQTFLAVPIWLLFEVGVFLSRYFRKQPDEEAPDEEDGTDAVPAGAVVASRDYQRMTPEEMEAELDRIEAEDLAARLPATSGAGAGDASDDQDDEVEEEAADEAEPAEEPARAPDPDDPLGRRAAAQAKLERVMALRAAGDLLKARQLLYEVLVEGTEDQVFVARNILTQLDEPG